MIRLGSTLVLLSLLIGGGVVAAGGGGAAAPEGVPSGAARVATPAPPADTLSYTVTAGEAFITDLPGTLRDQPVESYAIVEAPSMSWLVDRSFFWRTDQVDPGQYAIRLRATITDAPPDTLALHITVVAP